MNPTMRPPLPTYCVTFTLSHATDRDEAQNPVTLHLVNTIAAADPGTARILGEQIGRSAANNEWRFDPDSVQADELTADNLPALHPVLAAVEEEILHGQHAMRALSAILAKLGPVGLTQDEYDQAIPGAVAQIIGGGACWWVLPHQIGVPFSIGRLPALPDTGVVAGTDLHQHPGREVLVSSSDDPTAHVPASRWGWRTIIDVRDHPGGTAWKMLFTDQGAQPIVTAGAYSVRDPRPAPARHVLGEIDG